MKHLPVAAIILCLVACTGDRGSRQAPPAFVDQAAECGLDFVHFNGMTGRMFYAEHVGSGAALFDYDNDGDLDVYLVQGSTLAPGETLDDALFPPAEAPPRDRLFKNELRPDESAPQLRFVDVTEASGITAEGYGMGVTAGDFDNDGWVDLYVTNHGPNQLWRNNGDSTFTDVTTTSGTGDAGWSSSAAFLDYDRDGWLDLYLVSYLEWTPERDKDCVGPGGRRDYCGPKIFRPARDRLWHNRGDGTFSDVSERAGIGQAAGAGLGVVTSDFDGDGYLDIFVANDGMANNLWHNNGDGTFGDQALIAGVAVNVEGKTEASMGVDAGDIDNDGDLDLFMTHLAEESNTLYLNGGNGLFSDQTAAAQLAGPSLPYTAFGTAMIDYDNDGWLDIVAVNGAVSTIEELRDAGDPFPLGQPDQLFRNRGNGVFEDLSHTVPALTGATVSRGAAVGDIDNDGDPDLLIVDNNGPVRLLLDQVGQASHWLGVRLVTGSPPRDALGASLEVLRGRDPSLLRRAHADASFCSANDPRVLVGLGASDRPSTVRVRWPSGRAEAWTGLQSDRYHTLFEGGGDPAETVLSSEQAAPPANRQAPAAAREENGGPAVAHGSTVGSCADLPSRFDDLGLAVRELLEARRGALEKALVTAASPRRIGQALGAYGMALEANGEQLHAGACFRAAAEHQPESFEWRYYLAWSLFSQARYEAALEQFEQALELRPGHVPGLVWSADSAVALNFLNEAEQLYARALELDASCARALAGLGRVATARGDHEAALSHLERAETWQPGTTELRYLLGLAHRELGHMEKSQRYQEGLLPILSDQDPIRLGDQLVERLTQLQRGSVVHARRAGKAMAARQWPLALAELRQGLAADPGYTLAYYGIGLALLEMGRPAEAREAVDELLAALPDHTEGAVLLGRIMVARGQHQEAVQQFESILASHPTSARAELELARALRGSGRSEQALTHFTRAIELDMSMEAARLGRALAMIDLGRWVEAHRGLEQDILTMAHSRKLRGLLARLLAVSPAADVQDGGRALALAQETFEQAHNVSNAETVAMAMAALGRFTEAIQWQWAAFDGVRKRRVERRFSWVEERLTIYRGRRPCTEPWGASELHLPLEVTPPVRVHEEGGRVDGS